MCLRVQKSVDRCENGRYKMGGYVMTDICRWPLVGEGTSVSLGWEC